MIFYTLYSLEDIKQAIKPSKKLSDQRGAFCCLAKQRLLTMCETVCVCVSNCCDWARVCVFKIQTLQPYINSCVCLCM